MYVRKQLVGVKGRRVARVEGKFMLGIEEKQDRAVRNMRYEEGGRERASSSYHQDLERALAGVLLRG